MTTPIGGPSPSFSAGQQTLSFSTPQDLAAADLSSAPNYTVIYVGAVNDQYVLLNNLPSPPSADGLNVIAPANPPGAVALRQYVRNQIAQYQTSWVIDPVSGDDRNTGLPGAPLKSLSEWGNRMHNANVSQDVVVTLLSGTLTDIGPLDIHIATGVLVTLQGAFTSTTAAAFSAVTNTNPGGNVRGAVTDPSGAFARGQRLRTVSGSHPGAMTYCQGTTTSTVACVAQWAVQTNFHPPSNVHGTDVNVSIGDQYVIDTFHTTFQGRMDIHVRGAGRLLWKDVNFTSDPSSSFAAYEGWTPKNEQSTVGGVLFSGCQFDANCFALFVDARVYLSQCLALSDTTFGVGTIAGVADCVFQGFFEMFGLALVQAANAITVDGGHILQTNGAFIEVQGPIEIGATLAGGGQAWEVDPGCFTYQHSSALFWGPTSGYSYAVRTYSTSGYQYKNVPIVVGSTISDAIIAGVNKSWAQLPFENTTNMSAAVAIP